VVDAQWICSCVPAYMMTILVLGVGGRPASGTMALSVRLNSPALAASCSRRRLRATNMNMTATTKMSAARTPKMITSADGPPDLDLSVTTMLLLLARDAELLEADGDGTGDLVVLDGVGVSPMEPDDDLADERENNR
jgi:hypothetical protein